jgi:hypothetical protein
MKRAFFIFGIIVCVTFSCKPSGEVSRASATLVKDSQDSTRYEILITDPHFEQWYLVNFTPAKDYSVDYYRTKNITAVSNWNDFYRSGRYDKVVDSYIEYWPQVDYGMEVNRKLFWYFRYVVSNYGIRLF